MKLYQTTEKLSNILNKNWHVLPAEVRDAVKEHFAEIQRYFSPIRIYPELLPESWKQSTELCKALENYLKMLHEDGIPVTEATVQSVIGMIYIKVKDDVITASQSYMYSAAKRYKNPYVFNPTEQQQQITSFAMPSETEIRTVFTQNFDKITDHVLNSFVQFLQYAESEHKTTISGKFLYKYIGELSKLAENNLAKVTSILKYMQENKTITMPPNYSIIIKYFNQDKTQYTTEKQKNVSYTNRKGLQNTGNLIENITANLLPKPEVQIIQEDLITIWEKFVNTFIKTDREIYESAVLIEQPGAIEIHLHPALKGKQEVSYIQTALKQGYKTNKTIKITFDNI